MSKSAFLVSMGVATCVLFSIAGWAGQTRIWEQGEYNEFQKGVLTRLSLRSDGMLTLAPRFTERFDTGSSYLWSLAIDAKGNVYTGGGPGAKLFRLSAKGEKKAFAELEGLQIQAISIDAKDRVYVGTSPDGKVYRVAENGKAEVFYDPKAKYIWALVFDSKGNLFVGTGDQGDIHRVTPDGKGSVFVKSDEAHVRSLTVDRSDNLIAGTDPDGLVLRVSPLGEPFVLYQMAKKEVTAVAVAPNGAIYAAGVGTKQPASAPPPPPAPAAAPPSVQAAGAPPTAPRPSAGPPATLSAPAAVRVTGGSDVYRIDADGNPEKVWDDSDEIVYSIAFDAKGLPLLGTGNEGYIYRLDSDALYTAILNASPTQVTALRSGPGGKVFAATGNVGKVYELGPDLERQGVIESDAFDAGVFSRWGRLSFQGEPGGGKIEIVARSGNQGQPQKNWSAWSAPIGVSHGERLNVPPARFVQWKATLTAGGGNPPWLNSISVAYLPKNVAPQVEQIDITPENYRFPPPLAAALPNPTLNLPPLGTRSRRPSPSSTPSSSAPSMLFTKGYAGARWTAADSNGDQLIYKLEIRGTEETEWKLLQDKVRQPYWSWDSTAFPDGRYRLRVTASDSVSNSTDEALSSHLESEAFLIDNSPPHITGLTATPGPRGLVVRWKAADALSTIQKAEYSIDGAEWTVAPPMSGLSDSLDLEYNLTVQATAGREHTIAVRVSDEFANQTTEKVVVK